MGQVRRESGAHVLLAVYDIGYLAGCACGTARCGPPSNAHGATPGVTASASSILVHVCKL